MQLLLAILIGKLVAYFSRLFKIGGGTAAPGLYALKIDPGIVEKLSAMIPRNVVITGTNGKTTTARMLSHFAKEAGLKVIRNHTGSNLERGVASALIHQVNLGGGIDSNLGIWELDEAAFNTVAHKLKPDIIVFLNVFRDQLDRYGEVDSVVKKWSQTLKNLDPKTIVLVNGDDANTSKLGSYFKGKVYNFGFRDYKIVGEAISHKRGKENLDFEASNVKLNGLKGSSFQLTINHKPINIHLPLPGIYHIYDALAAIATTSFLFTDIPIHRLTDTLKSFSPAFGRVEKLAFPHSKWDAYIFLIKNPAGATQVFQTIAPQLKPNDRLLLALNDNLADGTDVSWIWDGEFEKLKIENLKLKIVCSGTRAADLALRLKYVGFEPKSLHVEPNLRNALKQARNGLKGRLFILPTYTAMLDLQKILTKQGVKNHYWEDNY
ncbi:MAG: MurT ligase domain-containing protein [Patescibacteria group bacterium]